MCVHTHCISALKPCVHVSSWHCQHFKLVFSVVLLFLLYEGQSHRIREYIMLSFPFLQFLLSWHAELSLSVWYFSKFEWRYYAFYKDRELKLVKWDYFVVSGSEGQKLQVHELCCCPSFNSVLSVVSVTIMLWGMLHSGYNAMNKCQKHDFYQISFFGVFWIIA